MTVAAAAGVAVTATAPDAAVNAASRKLTPACFMHPPDHYE
jgi:hypothetical protein